MAYCAEAKKETIWSICIYINCGQRLPDIKIYEAVEYSPKGSGRVQHVRPLKHVLAEEWQTLTL